MYGASTGSLNVYIVNKDDKSTLLWSKSGDQGNQWNKAKLMLESKLDYKVGYSTVLYSFIIGKENHHYRLGKKNETKLRRYGRVNPFSFANWNCPP